MNTPSHSSSPPEKANFTAWFVLQGLIAAVHRPEFNAPVDAPSLHLRLMLAKAAANQRLLSSIIHRLPYAVQYRIGQCVTDSTRLRHFYLRKKEIEAQVRAVLAACAIKQMVVLGSGLDVLPMSLAGEFPDVRFIEVDVEATQHFKQSVFVAHQVLVPANVEMICGDLRNPLAEVLAISTFKPGAPTLWLAEGLLMFLPEPSVRQLFDAIRAITGSDSRFIFTTLSPEEAVPRGAYAIQKLFLKKEKTPFQWTIVLDKLTNFMQSVGYRITGQASYKTLHAAWIGSKDSKARMEESITMAAPL